MNLELYSVTSLNRYIKQLFDNDFSLRGLKLKGEISNLKQYPNGHIYFSLKDDQSSIRAVMFKEYTKYIQAPIKDGDEIIAAGYVSTYPTRGEYQFYAQAIELAGAGQQLLELEILKKKLASEGLFDESHKRLPPRFPRRVGVISAPNSAALSDIRKNLLLRNPLLDIVLFPSLVQGSEAPKSLLNAVQNAEKENIDVLIIGRGGGASEDLSAFNDESLVRALYAFKVPVISAVGHEIDFTLVDYVADARASTPTGAAVLATIDKREIYEMLDRANEVLASVMNNRVNSLKEKVNSLKTRPFFINPTSMYQSTLVEIGNYKKRLDLSIRHYFSKSSDEVQSLSKRLQSLSYDSVLSRGFSLSTNENGEIIKSIKNVEIGQIIKTIVNDGCLTTKIINKEN